MSGAYVLTYDGQSSATAVPDLIVQTVDRDLLPQLRDEWVDVPGLDGSVHYPGAAGDRKFAMDFQIKATSREGRRQAVIALAKFLRRSTPRKLIISNEPDRFWMAKIASSNAVLERAAIRGVGTLDWRVAPYAQSLSTSSTTAASATAPNFTVNVSGSDVEVQPVLEITAQGNSATGFVVTIGGVPLTYGGNVNSGQIKTVSCVTATVVSGAWADTEFLTGAFDGASLDMASVTGAFGTLGGEGTSSIQLTGMAGSVRVVWRERYL